ncbi:unnamed protein product, partial [Dracunculus medinensis]|uniref:BZIP domain-containing protein n=1 Tax=Dracunculus medinensis TaxID=318479 RepID=A0A0N4UPM9_DRAME
ITHRICNQQVIIQKIYLNLFSIYLFISFIYFSVCKFIWQSNMIAGYNSSPSPLGMASGSRIGADSDDSTRKRQVRLLKNREAAKECRRKKKEYVKCLENRVAVLENQNKALIEELKTLKELYCRKEKAEL